MTPQTKRRSLLTGTVAATALAATLLVPGAATSASGSSTTLARAAAATTSFKVMSYNVRGPQAVTKHKDATRLGPRFSWANRLPSIAARIKANSPDLLGIQEASTGTINGVAVHGATGLKAQLPGYGVYPTTVAGSPKQIYFRSSRFEQVKWSTGTPRAGTIALSNTTTCMKRDATWTALREKTTKRVFIAVNAHLSAGTACLGTRATEVKNLRAALTTIMKQGKAPIVMTGDFNNQSVACAGDTAGKPLKLLVENVSSAGFNLNVAGAWTTNGRTPRCNATSNGGWPAPVSPTSKSRIDHIFTTPDVTATVPVIDRTANHTWGAGGTKRATPSDHFPITSILTLR